jgi:hypothetical protein
MHSTFSRLVLAAMLLRPALASGDTAPAPTARDQLAAVDSVFFRSYERAVREVLADGPPAFLVLPERLVLYRAGARAAEWPLIPPLFPVLKAVAHVTLGLFAVLSPTNGEPLGPEALGALRDYRGTIATALAALGQVGLDPAQRERQVQILDASSALAADTLAAGRVPTADLTTFCRRVRPLVEVNIREAVIAYLDELNGRMGTGLAALSDAERRDYLVIVTGVHQARSDNAAMQYFNRLMRDPAKITQRLMYAENVSDEDGALHLLGIHLMARRVGTAYFDDPYYMNRDLFGPAAAAHVPTMQLPE